MPLLILLLAVDLLLLPRASESWHDMLKRHAPLVGVYFIYTALHVLLGPSGGGQIAIKPGFYWPGLHMVSNTVMCVPQMLVPALSFLTYRNMLARMGVGENVLDVVHTASICAQLLLSALAGLLMWRGTPQVRFAVLWCYDALHENSLPRLIQAGAG